MRLIGFLALVICLVAIAAFATRPDINDFNALLKTTVEQRIATADVDASGDALGTIALVGCKLRPSDCVELIRQTLKVTEDRTPLYTRFTVTGARRSFTCTGAFTRIWCRRPLLED